MSKDKTEQVTVIKLELDVPKSKFKKVADLIAKINNILKNKHTNEKI